MTRDVINDRNFNFFDYLRFLKTLNQSENRAQRPIFIENFLKTFSYARKDDGKVNIMATLMTTSSRSCL